MYLISKIDSYHKSAHTHTRARTLTKYGITNLWLKDADGVSLTKEEVAFVAYILTFSPVNCQAYRPIIDDLPRLNSQTFFNYSRALRDGHSEVYFSHVGSNVGTYIEHLKGYSLTCRRLELSGHRRNFLDSVVCMVMIWTSANQDFHFSRLIPSRKSCVG